MSSLAEMTADNDNMDRALLAPPSLLTSTPDLLLTNGGRARKVKSVAEKSVIMRRVHSGLGNNTLCIVSGRAAGGM